MGISEIEENETILCVDMDGTLVRSDLLLEGVLLLLKANIFSAFRLLSAIFLSCPSCVNDSLARQEPIDYPAWLRSPVL